jgi:hypothetical protein
MPTSLSCIQTMQFLVMFGLYPNNAVFGDRDGSDALSHLVAVYFIALIWERNSKNSTKYS